MKKWWVLLVVENCTIAAAGATGLWATNSTTLFPASNVRLFRARAWTVLYKTEHSAFHNAHDRLGPVKWSTPHRVSNARCELPTWVSFWKLEVSDALFVQPNVPANSHISLSLRLLQLSIIVSFQFDQRTEDVLILIGVFVSVDLQREVTLKRYPWKVSTPP